MSLEEDIKKLSRKNQKIFARNCIEHVFPRVKEVVNKYGSKVKEAVDAVELVEKWLSNPDSVTSEQLRSAAHVIGWGANTAAWTPVRSAAESITWSATYTTYTAVDASFDAARSADAAIRSAAYAAAYDSYAASVDAKSEEREFQKNLLKNMIEQQEREKEEKLSFHRDEMEKALFDDDLFERIIKEEILNEFRRRH